MAEPDYNDADFIEKQRRELVEYFKNFPFFKLMGMEIVEIAPGRATLGMSWRADLTQPAGILHGGATAALIDTAIAHAILLTPQHLEVKAKGGGMVTVDLRVKYFRPVSSGRVLCESRVTRIGRQIVHATATVTDEAGKEVALGDSIYMLIARDQVRKKNE